MSKNKNKSQNSNTIESFENTEEEMTVTIDIDEGTAECAIVTILEVNSKDYIVLLPFKINDEEVDDGNVWIYRYSENKDDPNEEPVLDYIDDDDEYEAVADAFDEYLDDNEFDEII